MKVYDGTSDRDTLLKTICGSARPEAMLSSRNYLHLHFRSDEDVTRKGFKLRWKIDEGVKPEGIILFPPGQNFLAGNQVSGVVCDDKCHVCMRFHEHTFSFLKILISLTLTFFILQ